MRSNQCSVEYPWVLSISVCHIAHCRLNHDSPKERSILSETTCVIKNSKSKRLWCLFGMKYFFRGKCSSQSLCVLTTSQPLKLGGSEEFKYLEICCSWYRKVNTKLLFRYDLPWHCRQKIGNNATFCKQR